MPGETPEECVVREVKEESGLDVVSPQLRGVMTFPKFKNDEDWFVFLFTAETFSGQLRDCDEGRLEWISDDKIPELNLWEGDRLFMDWLNRDQFFSAKFLYENKKLINHKVVFYSGG